jgi:hypothetical protein
MNSSYGSSPVCPVPVRRVRPVQPSRCQGLRLVVGPRIGSAIPGVLGRRLLLIDIGANDGMARIAHDLRHRAPVLESLDGQQRRDELELGSRPAEWCNSVIPERVSVHGYRGSALNG